MAIRAPDGANKKSPYWVVKKMALHFHFDILTKPEFSVCNPLASENMGTDWDAMSLQHICFLNNFFTFLFWVEPVREGVKTNRHFAVSLTVMGGCQPPQP